MQPGRGEDLLEHGDVPALLGGWIVGMHLLVQTQDVR